MNRNDIAGETLYELANDIFDEVVFSNRSDLDAYNNEPSPYVLRDELYEIVGEMIHDAVDAMYSCAREERDRFLDMVHEQ